MTSDPSALDARTSRPRTLGLPVAAIIGLAALAVPRVVLHDLHLVEGSGPLTWLLTLVPVAIWIAAAVLARVPNPFLTVLVTGAVFGAMLVVTHQLLWDQAFSGMPPAIGGGALATVIPRLAAVISGLLTGALIGSAGGLVALAVDAAARRIRSAR